MRRNSIAIVAALAAGTLPVSARADYFNGFETDISGWDIFSSSFHATRVASGTNGVTSATGSWHAVTGTAVGGGTAAAGNWGGYGFNPGCAMNACAAAAFPAAGYVTSLKIYLDVGGGWSNNTRFDLSSAVSTPAGGHRRDFIFNGGFYNDSDGSPGSGTSRFIVSASNNSQPGSAFAKNPANDPIAISSSGWYTFTHTFYDNGSGILAVDFTIHTAGGSLVHTWTRSDPTDVLNSTVGGNRYGWFDFVEFPALPFDDTSLAIVVHAVKNLDTAETFETIQEAIDDTDTLDGHTLMMLVPEHTEGPQIHVTKDLTLTGGSPNVILAGGNTGSSGDARGWFLVDVGVELHVADLTFDGNGFLIFQAFRHRGTGSFQNCRFRDLRFQASGSPYAGNAITAFGPAGPVDVLSCHFEEIGRHGIFYFGAGVSGSLCDGNQYSGKGPGDWLDYGIELGAGADVTVTNNTIGACRGVASDASTSAGILITTFFGAGTAAELLYNTFTDNTTGVYAGFDASDTSVVTAHFNSIVGNDNGLINTSSTETADAKDNWWGDASGPADPLGMFEADNPPCFDSDFNPILDVSNIDGAGDSVSDGNVDYCPWLQAPGILSLLVNDDCNDGGVGATVTVTIRMSDVKDLVVGGQFFLEYDETVLDFVSAVPGAVPFTTEVFELVNESLGTIDYAVGVSPFDDPGTADDSNLAVLTFTALQEACDAASLVSFRAHTPPTRLTNDLGGAILALTNDLGTVTIDGTSPGVTEPADIAVNADAGGCDAAVVVPALMVMDNCRVDSVTNSYTGTSNASGTYPSGMTLVTWTVTDNCDNQTMVDQIVTVNAFNDLTVAVQLQNLSPGTITRCITFELFDCDGPDSEVVEAELTFTGGLATDTIDVPCGSYDCITARDALHTLKRTDDDGDFMDAGTAYVADFTAAGTSDDSLVGGNLNDDEFIDILDFGAYAGEFGTNYGTADTTCLTPFPHADVSGNGLADTADFTFIQINFLEFAEANCCGLAPLAGGPVVDISVKELRRRGLWRLAAGDLNGDGRLNVDDIAAFMQGARPQH